MQFLSSSSSSSSKSTSKSLTKGQILHMRSIKCHFLQLNGRQIAQSQDIAHEEHKMPLFTVEWAPNSSEPEL
jgi:hypothetical protein